MRPLALPVLLALACQAPAPATTFDRSAHGVRVRQTAIALEGGAGRLIVAEFQPGAAIEVLPAASPAPLESFAAAAPGRTCVAINGGFYDAGGAMGWVVHAGHELAPLRPGGGSGLLVVEDGLPRIVHRDHAPARPREALQSIDRLVDGGLGLVGPNARPDLDARSAVALRADGTLLLAVAFADRAVVRESAGRVELGRASSSTGLSLAAWADLLARPVADGGLGAATALNLDGGYSTSLSVAVGEQRLDVVAHVATINAVRVCAR